MTATPVNKFSIKAYINPDQCFTTRLKSWKHAYDVARHSESLLMKNKDFVRVS